jgi:N-acetyl-anhydromuramyl-L-alanine amidase AmpD
LHFDVCGLSRTCFKILQERKLSVHFLLDLDGTLYQTLDLRDTAWHATKANDRSIGVEIAHIGARSPGDTESLEEWYSSDSHGPYIDLPARFGDGGLRTSAFRGRPARPELVEGRINGTRLVQYDFTPEQYETLAALCRALTRVLPQIRARVPRDARGEVIEDALSDAAFRSFSGILGHYHVQTNKTDPGPAFDWERILRSSL